MTGLHDGISQKWLDQRLRRVVKAPPASMHPFHVRCSTHLCSPSRAASARDKGMR